jgi:hypothetical protein
LVQWSATGWPRRLRNTPDDDGKKNALRRQRVQLLQRRARQRHDVELAGRAASQREQPITELVQFTCGIARQIILGHECRERAVDHVLVHAKFARKRGDAARFRVARKCEQHFEHALGRLIAISDSFGGGFLGEAHDGLTAKAPAR